MNEVKVVISPYDMDQVNALWNKNGNKIELSWGCPKVFPSPMVTTNMSYPWWKLSMLCMNLCTVPVEFLETMKKNQIKYFTEKEYYEKLIS